MEISQSTIFIANEIYEILLQNCGAITPNLDVVDQRVIDDIRENSGSHYYRSTQLDWPVIANGNYPQDADRDGMPNYWEDQNGLDANNPDDANLDVNSNGYTNIEEYLNSLIPQLDESPRLLNKPDNLRIGK